MKTFVCVGDARKLPMFIESFDKLGLLRAGSRNELVSSMELKEA